MKRLEKDKRQNNVVVLMLKVNLARKVKLWYSASNFLLIGGFITINLQSFVKNERICGII